MRYCFPENLLRQEYSFILWIIFSKLKKTLFWEAMFFMPNNSEVKLDLDKGTLSRRCVL